MKRFTVLVVALTALLLLSAVSADACRGRLLRGRMVQIRQAPVVTRTTRVRVYRRPLLRRWVLRCRAVPVATVVQPKDTEGRVTTGASNGPPATIEGRAATDDDVIDIDDNDIAPPEPDDIAPPVPDDAAAPLWPVPVEPAFGSIRGMRLWTDASGQRQVTAEFASVDGDNVYLNTKDGRLVWTAMWELSRQDQELIRNRTVQQVALLSAR